MDGTFQGILNKFIVTSFFIKDTEKPFLVLFIKITVLTLQHFGKTPYPASHCFKRKRKLKINLSPPVGTFVFHV